jgi:hypothetical protein
MKVVGKGTKKEANVARRLLYALISMRPVFRGPKPARSIISLPNMAGTTDSSQRMVDFTEARRLGVAAGDVDRYRRKR